MTVIIKCTVEMEKKRPVSILFHSIPLLNPLLDLLWEQIGLVKAKQHMFVHTHTSTHMNIYIHTFICIYSSYQCCGAIGIGKNLFAVLKCMPKAQNHLVCGTSRRLNE